MLASRLAIYTNWQHESSLTTSGYWEIKLHHPWWSLFCLQTELKCYPHTGRKPLMMETDGLWFWLCCKLFTFTSHSSTTHRKVTCTFLLLLLLLTLPQSWFAVTGCSPLAPQQWHPSFYCSGSHDRISKYVGRDKNLLITMVKYSVTHIHESYSSNTTVAAGRSLWPTDALVHLCTLIRYRFLC